MLAPPNWGEAYDRAVRPHLSPSWRRRTARALYPFFLEGVAMKPELNQPDGLHPNERGVAVLVEPHRAGGRRADCPASRRCIVSARFAGQLGDRRARRSRGALPRRPGAGRSRRISASSMSASRRPRPCHSLLGELAAGTGIRSWVGGVGLGVCSADERDLRAAGGGGDHRARLPDDGFRDLWRRPTIRPPICRAGMPTGSRSRQPALALVHADPRCPDLTRATVDAAAASGAFLVGGLVSHRCGATAGRRRRRRERAGRQGRRRADAGAGDRGRDRADPRLHADRPGAPDRRGARQCRDGDRRPPGARASFVEDIGPDLAQDMRRLGGVIFAGLPVAGSDTGDYLVRNLMAIDPGRGWIVLGAEIVAGRPDRVLPARPRERPPDMARMLRQLAGRLNGPPKAGVYVSCVARGAALFGEAGVETGLIRETFGDFPLVGFFANGEISRDRLYGHTGVLTLFT